MAARSAAMKYVAASSASTTSPFRRGCRSALRKWPCSTISSIEVSEGPWGHSIQDIAAGNTISMTWTNVGQDSELVDHVKAMIGKNEKLLLSSSDVSDQIKKLGELIELGLLPEDEFQSK